MAKSRRGAMTRWNERGERQPLMHAFHRNFSDRPCQRRTSTRLFESAIGLPDQQASDHSLIRLPVLQPRSVLFAQMRNSVRLITQISLSTVDCANKLSARHASRSHVIAPDLKPPPSMMMNIFRSGMRVTQFKYRYGNFSSTLPFDCCHLHSMRMSRPKRAGYSLASGPRTMD